MQIWNTGQSFTRPNDTTAYASGDLVANSTTAGSVVPLTFTLGDSWPQGQCRITRMRLVKSGTTATLSAFRVHLYDGAAGTITFANGDNGAMSTNKAANYLGNIDFTTTMFPFTDGCSTFGAAPAGSEIFFRAASGNTILAILEARAAYVPAANEVFTLTIEELQAY